MLYDLAIIGGGVNGCGIARDAAGRGAKVILFEQHDLASGTSSASTKLIHGGLRYLEHFKFGLVRQALAEREALYSIAPHLIKPASFVLPHRAGMRPQWLLKLALWIYDNLSPRSRLPPSTAVDLTTHPAGSALKSEFRQGFVYADCRVDDARLVVLNARDAADRGASINVGTKVTRARRVAGSWEITVENQKGEVRTYAARTLVNAAGPWVGMVLSSVLRMESQATRLVQGSHIVVPRLFDHAYCYIFQNPDGRVIFAIPYQHEFTLIGTTDVDCDTPVDSPRITGSEREYLVAAAGVYFKREVRTVDIVWDYSGVRSLYDDGAGSAKDASRDYVLKAERDGPLLINVFGGKITTYRRLAEEVVSRLLPTLEHLNKNSWTLSAALPGGDFPVTGGAALHARWQAAYPFLPAATVTRLCDAYGTAVGAVLGPAESVAQLGVHFGADLYEREVSYLIDREWARTAQDILWRRSKLGLALTREEAARLEVFVRGAALGAKALVA